MNFLSNHLKCFSWKAFLLILLHLFIFNFLFVYRYSPSAANEQGNLWGKSQLKVGILDYLKLYFSSISDEAYYYQWSSYVLGKYSDSELIEMRWNEKKKKGLEYIASHDEENQFKRNFLNHPKVLPYMTIYPQEKDSFSEWNWSHHFKMPYRDVNFEYPPLMMIPILLARVISHDFLSFTKVLAFLVSLAYLASLYLIYRIWQKLPSEHKMSWTWILLLSGASLLSLGQIYVTRLDVFPSLIFLMALHAFLNKKLYRSAIWIVIGTFTKAYPLLLAPLFAIYLLRRGKIRQILYSGILVVGLLILINLFLAWVTEGRYWETFRYHHERGIQIESLYALVPFLGYWFFDQPIQIYNRHHSLNIGASNGGVLLDASQLIPILLFLLIYAMAYRRLKINDDKNNDAPVILSEASLLLVFAFLLSFKVFSPQFIIWLTPLIFLFSPKWKTIYFGIFIFALILTQVLYPNFYFLLTWAHPLGITMLLIRNTALVVLFAWTFIDLWKKFKSERAHSST